MFCLLAHDAVFPHIYCTTFRRDMLPKSAVSKSKTSVDKMEENRNEDNRSVTYTPERTT
jgi:hypothetical protein